MPRTPTPYDTATGGKHPEFAIFYNTAFFRVAGLVNDLLGKPQEHDKEKLEVIFKGWICNRSLHSDKILLKLKNYLWKGYLNDKNSSGTILEENDKVLIVQMLQKLSDIRNFHSHYYHINDVLALSPELEKFVESLHEQAKFAQLEGYPKEVQQFEEDKKRKPLFKSFEGKSYLTQEGRTFFLSFFVTQGEMARFLQQRAGSKRNDKPEFKIKHLIYRHYTHRDGAARHHYGQEENVLSSLPEKQQKEILAFRSAAKIASYLNDVPPTLYDTDLFPLFLASGIAVTNAPTLQTFCEEKGIFSTLAICPKTWRRKNEDGTEITGLSEQVLEIKLRNNTNYVFEMGRSHLQQLVLLCINGFRTEEFVMDKLQFFVAERATLLTVLEQPKTIEKDNDKLTINQFLDEYYRYKLRGSDFLRRKMGAWLSSIESRKNIRGELQKFKEAIENEPIELGFYDFFFEEDEKPRHQNQFMTFAVQYLIDSGVVKKWHWAFEKFEIEIKTKTTVEYGKNVTRDHSINKRKLTYNPTILPKHRLAFTPDNQIVVAIYPDNDTTKTPQLFTLGHRAMKNLLIAHFEGKDISSFFYKVIADLNNLNNLKVLDKNSLPTALRTLAQMAQQPSVARLKADAIQRMERIIKDELKPFLDGKKHLKRAEKNRQIMRCYLFFDWQYPQDSQFKFLRQDEYKRMSVYHYLLDKPNAKQKYGFLLEGIKQHMPDTIKDMLDKAENFENLLKITIEKSIQRLEKWVREMPDYSTTKAQKIASKVGISIGKTPQFESYIPFDIHPILPVRCFYEQELKADKFSLSERWWNDAAKRQALRPELYQYQAFLEQHAPEKKTKRYIIGDFNALLTQDTLLWRMAQWYFSQTSTAYQQFLSKHDNDWRVQNLRKSPCLMHLGDLSVRLEFHQLDDYLLVESKPVIERAARQVLRRFDLGEYEGKQVEIKIEIKDDKKQYELPYEEVFREIQRVHNQSVHWAKYILAWEKTVVDAHRSQITSNYVSFRQVCEWAKLDANMDKLLREQLRNTVFHAEIPDGFTYQELEQKPDLVKLLHYEKKEKKNYEIGL